MSLNIIQWNINGFVKKLNNIQILNHKYNPLLLCLQETNLNDTYTPFLKNYKLYHSNRTNCGRASGGVAILARTDYPTSQIQLKSNLEAIAITIQLESNITICNLYIPNQKPFSSLDIENIIQQLPHPFLLVGDFNSHSENWGSERTDLRGKEINKILENDNIVLLNNGDHTRLNPANGLFSTIDLSLSSPPLAQRISWTTLAEIYDSDHIPIKMELLSHKTSPYKTLPKWKIKNPNWCLFSQLIETNLATNPPPTDGPIDNDITLISETIINAANLSIGKTKISTSKPCVPWWNSEIKEAIQNKNKALKTFQKSGNTEDLIKLKQLRAKTKYLVKTSKENSWKTFTSSITPSIDSGKIWSKVRSLRGNIREKNTHLIIDNTIHTNPNDVANLLGISFQTNSSDDNYDTTFINNNILNRNSQYISNISPSSQDQIHLNFPISINELNWAISKCSSLSPGPDDIPYIFLQNLPLSALVYILHIYNKIWNNGMLPKAWKHSIVIPILKPGNDKFKLNSYRPISLLNTMCKLLEKIIDTRLRWYLEKINYLTPQQNGFRKHRSTYNSLQDIQENIKKTFNYNQVLGLVALDISKAYDTTWRPGILEKLRNILCNGNMFNFIKDFLSDRSFQVKINNYLSPSFNQQNGVPQGSTLSVTLFLIAINDICDNIKFPVQSTLFADDLSFFCRGKNLNSIQPALQNTIDSLLEWSSKTGFTFSAPKSRCTLFTRFRKNNKLELHLNNTPIPYTKTTKILGIIFDNKNTWQAHLKEIRKATLIKLNIIKVLAHTTWGANGTTLKQIYKSLIMSKLEYGAFLYIDAKQSLLKMIETIHNSGLRLVTGAFRSSPIPSILNIANTPPLDLKRIQNALLQKARRAQNSHTPNIENKIKLNNFEFNCSGIFKHEHPITPPWVEMDLHSNTDLSFYIKSETMDITYRNLAYSLLEDYQDYTLFYTDGSKTEEGVGASIYSTYITKMFKLPDFCSIYTAEAYAISQTLEVIKQHKINKAIILSDSLSSLKSIRNTNHPNTISKIIQNQISLLNINNQNVKLLWIPSHVGIIGNETADTYAKRAINSPDAISIQICSLSDIKGVIQSLTLQQWQHRWSLSHTKLNEIKLHINPWPPSFSKRRHEVIINRLRIGHTWLTHRFLMRHEEPEQCITCGETLTVKHVLLYCQIYADTRTTLNIPDHLYEALGPDQENSNKIITFLKTSKLYNLI